MAGIDNANANGDATLLLGMFRRNFRMPEVSPPGTAKSIHLSGGRLPAYVATGAVPLTSGNLELCAELQRLAAPPKDAGIEWFDVQIREMEELNRRLPHGVRLHTRLSETIYDLNGFMFALDIATEAVSDMRLAQIFPGQRFVQWLSADGHLRETKAKGSIGIDFIDGVPEKTLKYELAKPVIQRVENFTLSPGHYDTWSADKQARVLQEFEVSLKEPKEITVHPDLNIFL